MTGLPLLLALWIAGGGPAQEDDLIRRARAAEAKRIELIERVSPSVVALFRKEGAGGGSGVIIDPAGYVLTNYHVVGGAKEMRAGLPGGRVLAGRVIGIDPYADLALVRLLAVGPFPYSPVADPDTLSVGDWTLAMGNPFLLATDFRPTVTLGIASGLHRFQPGPGRQLVYVDCVQVDTPINPGNSGGPLFDMTGRVVGINGRISGGNRGRVNVGVGFAVSANQIHEVLSDLRAGKLVAHGTLDATVKDVEDPTAERGVRVIVNQLYEDSVAALAGMRLGDELLEFDGVAVRSQNHFLNLIGVLPAGRTVEVMTRRRDDRAEGGWLRQKARVTLAGIPVRSEIREKHETDAAHVAWETKRILGRYRLETGTDPLTPLAWEATRERADGGAGRVRSFHAGRLYRREIEEEGGSPRVITLDDEGARVRTDADRWAPLEEEVAADLRTEVDALAAIAYGDPGRFRSAAFIGGDKIDGRHVDIVETETDEGHRVEWLFDPETGLLAGYRYASKAAKGAVMVVRLGDYRRAGDRFLPHEVTRGVGGGPVVRDRIVRYLPVNEIPEAYRKVKPIGEAF